MAWGQWWPYSATLVATDRDEFGVYELGDDAKGTVYYGSGKIKTRLMEHLNKEVCPMAKHYRVEYLDEQESKAREEQLLRDYKSAHGGKLPMYNESVG